MKAASINQIKAELSFKSQSELIDLCLRLSKFKKENKELLTYLLFESSNEIGYIESVKAEIKLHFDSINTSNFYYIKKSVRKVLRLIKKYSSYSSKKETEVELLIFFCVKLTELKPSIAHNMTLKNLYKRQLVTIKKIVSTLHEDLQYDYQSQIQRLENSF
ncbi:hypothetical protein M0G43_00145 [Subsaxibacter sp. CAU 1640]|uniref:hypothetical protein n=1 Tax=Subsaxibacter sp. CAU 1640 TaxID=2933271 RepID=UPI00200671C1|nr:hypothetical protein [Subsaxibacter sp. CAU 1640]MCK7588973.1 hypothetical protein [Subsaxibacter sp. CAU 1640]